MSKKAEAFLRNGEVVAWGSRPELTELLDADNGNRILGHWMRTVFLTLTLLSLYVGFGQAKAVPVTVVVAAALWQMLLPLVELKRIARYQRYYITNQRVVLCGKKDSLSYMELSEIDALLVVVGHNGRKSLVLGSCLFEDCRRQLRRLTLHPKADPAPAAPAGHAVGLTFYEPRNVEGALVLLRSRAIVRENRPPARTKGGKWAA